MFRDKLNENIARITWPSASVFQRSTIIESLYTAVSRQVVGKSVRDNTEMIYREWLLTAV